MKHFFVVLGLLFCWLLLAASQSNAQFIQQGNKLVGTGAVPASYQGISVSISADGNTAIEGGQLDNSGVGAAWVFTRSGGVWTQQGFKLVGTGAVGTASQGISVSISGDGNTAIVGGYNDNSDVGAAWVYTRSGGVWSQQGGKLVGTGAVGVARQGESVSISGDGNTAIVGGYNDNSGVGAAWVYTRSGGVWTQQGSKLVGTGGVAPSWQGWSVSLSADGNTAIAGGSFDNSNVGAVWVYTRSGGVWTQQGSKLVGTGAVGLALQGSSVSLSSDGNTAIVGGYFDNIQTGAAWIYTRSGGVWTQQGSKLVGTGAVGVANQGCSVSISYDGNIALIGGTGDNSANGATWVFTRNVGVWTQQGAKLVGTGFSGVSEQGYSVSLSGDGNTAIVGGTDDNGNVGAAWVYYGPSGPIITSVSDIPNDQGGHVGIEWNGSSLDNAFASPQITSYSIWRALPGSVDQPSTVPSSEITLGSNGKKFRQYSINGVTYSWEWLADQPARSLPQYGYTSPTNSDSISPVNNGMEYFLVFGETGNQNIYYVSNIDSGYSVDNIPPIPPAGLNASVVSGPQVQLNWNSPTDPDVGHYDVYRSTTSGFTPSPGLKIGTASTTNFNDASPLTGNQGYYVVEAVDIHGNVSLPSAQVSAGVAVTSSFSVSDKWNMVSVPFSVSDYSKSVLFPQAISQAFAYQGSYVIDGTLQPGTGYWLKFNGSQSVPVTGLYITQDTITVSPGWNMIGSLSTSIPVTNVSSIPGGMITSNFFGYSNAYHIATTIDPAVGYWIKVNQGGKLVLSSSKNVPSSTKIRMELQGEKPPAPPKGDGTLANRGGLPTEYELEQNYPNPFNPSTVINYALPTSGFVRLTIYNMLGQEVMTAVNETQDAGYKSITLNMNNLPSGLYTYRITSGTFTEVKKMVLIK